MTKKQDKPKKEPKSSKPRSKPAPWKGKNVDRLKRLLNLTNIAVAKTSQVPGIEQSATAAVLSVETMLAKLVTLPDDFRPAKKGGGNGKPKKGKPGVGVTVALNPEHADKYKSIGAALFDGGVIASDADFDPHYWLITCLDGVKRVAKKKHVIVKTTPAAEAAS
jgi:hypothetical protein